VSHHLDTPLAAQTGQLYLDDLYVFPANGSTVLVMDVNSNVNGLHSEPGYIGDQVTAVVAATGTVGDAGGYGQAVARELFPDVLPYVVGTPAAYSFTGFNGRTQADNAPEAMLSLVAGMAVPSGLRPSVAAAQRTSDFPYVVPA
jgi:hypothetical protein